MPHYGFTAQTADLHAVLWTEGATDTNYFVEFIINGETPGPTWPITALSDRAVAVLSWTDPAGTMQQFTIGTPASTQNEGGTNQVETGEISVKSLTSVHLDCVHASGSYSVSLDTAS